MAKPDIERQVRESVKITEFQRRVYLALLEVPEGKTISYKELAERIVGHTRMRMYEIQEEHYI